MPGFPAARITDLHTCAITFGVPTPIAGICSPNVITMGLPQARITDLVACMPGNQIALGSMTVLVNGLPAARVTSVTSCGGIVLPPCALTVLIGG